MHHNNPLPPSKGPLMLGKKSSRHETFLLAWSWTVKHSDATIPVVSQWPVTWKGG